MTSPIVSSEGVTVSVNQSVPGVAGVVSTTRLTSPFRTKPAVATATAATLAELLSVNGLEAPGTTRGTAADPGKAGHSRPAEAYGGAAVHLQLTTGDVDRFREIAYLCKGLGIALTVATLTGLLGTPVGRLIDRGSHRTLMVLGLLGMAGGTTVAAAAPNIWWFGASLVLIGLAKLVFDVAMTGWVAEYVPADAFDEALRHRDEYRRLRQAAAPPRR